MIANLQHIAYAGIAVSLLHGIHVIFLHPGVFQDQLPALRIGARFASAASMHVPPAFSVHDAIVTNP
jgi:hypothetical protein